MFLCVVSQRLNTQGFTVKLMCNDADVFVIIIPKTSGDKGEYGHKTKSGKDPTTGV